MSRSNYYVKGDERTKVEIDDVSIIERYRQSHHAIATMFAMGYHPSKICRITGRSRRSLTLIYNNPMFQELIAQKVKEVAEEGAKATEEQIKADFEVKLLMTRNHLLANQQLNEKLEQADVTGELMPTRELQMIASDLGDRLGYSKHTIVTHTADFASQLDRAISRSNRQKQIQTIDGEVVSSVPDFSKEPAALPPVSTQPQAPRVAPELVPSQAQRPQAPGRPSFVDALKRKFA